MNLYVYFDFNGNLKEVVRDGTIRQADISTDVIYVYWERKNTCYYKYATYKLPNGETTNEEQFEINSVSLEIPFNKKRSLKYFEYGKEYDFDYIEISQEVLSYSGLVGLTLRYAITTDSLQALDVITFMVEESVVLDDSNITLTQYQYLIQLLSSKFGYDCYITFVDNLPSGESIDVKCIYYVKTDNINYYNVYKWNETTESWYNIGVAQLDLSELLENYVDLTSEQTISGEKTFNSSIKLQNIQLTSQNAILSYSGLVVNAEQLFTGSEVETSFNVSGITQKIGDYSTTFVLPEYDSNLGSTLTFETKERVISEVYEPLESEISNIKNTYATVDWVNQKLSGVYTFKGSVDSYSNLPTSGNTAGDVYNVNDTGDNYAWTGSEWDKLAGDIDLSDYYTISQIASIYQPLIIGNQLLALNSGITSTLVSYYNSELQNLNNYVQDLNTIYTNLSSRISSVESEVDAKQDTLVSGTNIKTINGESVLGSGNIYIDSDNVVLVSLGTLDTSSGSHVFDTSLTSTLSDAISSGKRIHFHATNIGYSDTYDTTLLNYLNVYFFVGNTLYIITFQTNVSPYAYDVNTYTITDLTSAQLEAINSGITATMVSNFGNNIENSLTRLDDISSFLDDIGSYFGYATYRDSDNMFVFDGYLEVEQDIQSAGDITASNAYLSDVYYYDNATSSRISLKEKIAELESANNLIYIDLGQLSLSHDYNASVSFESADYTTLLNAFSNSGVGIVFHSSTLGDSTMWNKTTAPSDLEGLVDEVYNVYFIKDSIVYKVEIALYSTNQRAYYWVIQYDTSSSDLTEAQLEAINSGITASKVATYDAYSRTKQNTLVSGSTIKTINGNSLLGSGDITFTTEENNAVYIDLGELDLTATSSSTVNFSYSLSTTINNAFDNTERAIIFHADNLGDTSMWYDSSIGAGGLVLVGNSKRDIYFFKDNVLYKVVIYLGELYCSYYVETYTFTALSDEYNAVLNSGITSDIVDSFYIDTTNNYYGFNLGNDFSIIWRNYNDIQMREYVNVGSGNLLLRAYIVSNNTVSFYRVQEILGNGSYNMSWSFTSTTPRDILISSSVITINKNLTFANDAVLTIDSSDLYLSDLNNYLSVYLDKVNTNSISSSVDLNNYTENGKYYIESLSNASNSISSLLPDSSVSAFLEVVAGGSEVVQVIRASKSVYQRNYNGTEWSDWEFVGGEKPEFNYTTTITVQNVSNRIINLTWSGTTQQRLNLRNVKDCIININTENYFPSTSESNNTTSDTFQFCCYENNIANGNSALACNETSIAFSSGTLGENVSQTTIDFNITSYDNLFAIGTSSGEYFKNIWYRVYNPTTCSNDSWDYKIRFNFKITVVGYTPIVDVIPYLVPVESQEGDE